MSNRFSDPEVRFNGHYGKTVARHWGSDLSPLEWVRKNAMGLTLGLGLGALTLLYACSSDEPVVAGPILTCSPSSDESKTFVLQPGQGVDDLMLASGVDPSSIGSGPGHDRNEAEFIQSLAAANESRVAGLSEAIEGGEAFVRRNLTENTGIALLTVDCQFIPE